MSIGSQEFSIKLFTASTKIGYCYYFLKALCFAYKISTQFSCQMPCRLSSEIPSVRDSAFGGLQAGPTTWKRALSSGRGFLCTQFPHL